MTIGEKRVRTDFNVGGGDEIAEIKKAGADFINLIEKFKQRAPREAYIAQINIETATMYAVKAATSSPKYQ